MRNRQYPRYSRATTVASGQRRWPNSTKCRYGLAAAAAIVIGVAIFHGNAKADEPQRGPSTLDATLDAAVDDVLQVIESFGVPCDVEGTPPIAIWQAWRHRDGQSLVASDRGFGQYIAQALEARIPCRSAVQGDDRDRLLRELQLQSLPFYDSSQPHFRTAGRQFSRSLFLVSGDWWMDSDTTVSFTARVYHMLEGESLRDREHRSDGYEAMTASIPNRRVRGSLAPHVYLSIHESFDVQAAEELGRPGGRSIVESAIADSLQALPGRLMPPVITRDSSLADIHITGAVRFGACPLTEMMERIVGDRQTFAYRTETHLEFRSCLGASRVWSPGITHRCPPLTGAVRRRPNADRAYADARGWLVRGDGSGSVAANAGEWAAEMVYGR